MDVKKSVLLFSLAAAALSAAPQLQLSTTALGPFSITGGTNGPQQNVQVTNAGDGTLNVSVSSTASWLAPSYSNNNIQISLNTASLAAGSYTEFVIVSSPGAIDAPQNISVTVNIGGVPSSLQFYAVPGGPPVKQTINAHSMLTAAASTSSGGNWLTVSLNSQSSYFLFYPYNVVVTPQDGQAAGDYNGTVTLSGASNPADNKSVPVTLHLTSQPIIQFAPAMAVLISSQGGGKATQNVSVQNVGQGSLATTGATGSASWLTASVLSSTAIAVTADPSGLAPGTYRGSLTISANSANESTTPLPVEFLVGPPSGPVISFGGVVDNAVGRGILAPGDIAAAYGVQLAGETPVSAGSIPLQTTLGGVQVSVNGIPAPVYYASSGQVNFVVPWAVKTGQGTVSITLNGNTGNTVSTTIAARAPRIPLLGYGGYGIIVNSADGSFPATASPGFFSHPAKAGDVLIVYAIGGGLTDQNVADGAASPANPLANTPLATVMFGGGFASTPVPGVVNFSGLTPGSVGLYQINVVVPPGVPTGDSIPLTLQIEKNTANPVFVAIGK